MRQIRTAFDGAAKTARMDAALYVDPRSGRQAVVRLPGTPLKEGEVYYYDAEHKGCLYCSDCGVPARFLPGSDTAVSGSSLKGPGASFTTFAGQRHDTSCEFYTDPKKAAPGRKKTDDTKGYRVHINTREYSDLFTPKNGPYSRRGAITKINDPDLADREIYTVKSAADLVEFMTMKETNRVVDSVVIFGNGKPIPWKEFFVRYSRGARKQKRFLDLLSRLRAGGKDAQIPVLMEMQITRPQTGYPYGLGLLVLSRRMFCERGADGRRRDIVPAVRLDRQAAIHDKGVSGAFNHGCRQLVLGLATLHRSKNGHYCISVVVSDAEQVETVNIENIMKRATARAHIGKFPSPESVPK